VDEHRELLLAVVAGLLLGLAARFLAPVDDDADSGPLAAPVEIADLEADPATGLPLVPGDASMLFNAGADAPDDPLDVQVAFRSANPTRPLAPAEQRVDLLATFPDSATALTIGQSLAAAAGDLAAEARWLSDHDVETDADVGGGFGWVGPELASVPFVQVVGRHVIVGDLAYVESLDVGDGTPEGWGYRTALVRALEASGATVLVEGDRSGEGAITMDLACSGARDDLTPLEQDAADLQQQPVGGLQAPWLGDGITASQRAARRTHRLLATLQSQSFRSFFDTDPELRRLMGELQAAGELGGAGTQEIIAAIQARSFEAMSGGTAPDLGPFASVLDQEVVGWTLADQAEAAAMVAALDAPDAEPPVGPSEADQAESEHRRQVLGASPAGVYRDGTFVGGVGIVDGDLALTFATWSGLAVGFAPLVRWLDAGGCHDIRVAFYDFDDVRGD
jgi:hypothetical protein